MLYLRGTKSISLPFCYVCMYVSMSDAPPFFIRALIFLYLSKITTHTVLACHYPEFIFFTFRYYSYGMGIFIGDLVNSLIQPLLER